jgi:hypothetical protein
MGLWQHRLVKIMGICSIATFVASMLLHLCECTPIQRNWQVKPYAGGNYLFLQRFPVNVSQLTPSFQMTVLCELTTTLSSKSSMSCK